MDRDEAYAKAVNKAEAKIGFLKHLAVYVGVNLLLLIIDLATSQGDHWFYWPLLGWGIAVAIHAVGTYWGGGDRLRNRLIEKEMAKLDRSQKDES